MLEIGASAPDFEAATHTGDTVKLSDQSQYVVLWFYPKADTPG